MKFGQYELLERVAVGGMAEVYRGRVAGAEGFEKWVAIKRILPEYARDDRFISMMLTEARIHSALSHRNIVQIHDLGISEDGEYFIVLEYVEGYDLRTILEAAAELGVQIPDSLALYIADELAQALHFAHELADAEGQPLGIIHRDVSPSNVLISNSGEVKLSDFGIAKRRHDHSFVGSLKGNLVYMSPEQAQRVPLDRRTDVFSLGAVLFEMVTGQKLREITDEVNGFREVASGVVRSARALRPDLPEAYEALLNRALAANPADRFPNAAEFGAAIRELGRENDTPVGPADMKELLELLNPPRRARNPVDRSKVIRLGPEFRVLSGAHRPKPADPAAEETPVAPPSVRIPATRTAPPASAASAGAATPALAPGVVPPDLVTPKGSNGNGNGNRSPIWAEPAGARLTAPTPDPAFSMPPTPAPPVSRAPFGTTVADPQATPPPPSRPEAAATPSANVYTRTRPFGTSIAAAGPTPGGAVDDPASAMLTPPPKPGAFGVQSIPRAPSGPITATGWSAPLPLDRPPSGPVAAPTNQEARISRPFVLPPASAEFAPAPPVRRRRGWLRVLLVFLALVGAGAAVVHFKVMPLAVAAVWFKPATLEVTSNPPGATLRLDGREIPDQTPLRFEVRRDRGEHTLELSRPGSKPVRTTMRFDRTVLLSQSLTLPEEPPPPPPPVETPPEPPTVEAQPAEAAADTEPDADADKDEDEDTVAAKPEAKKGALAPKKAKKAEKAKLAAKAKKAEKAKLAAKKAKKAKSAAKAKPSAEPASEL